MRVRWQLTVRDLLTDSVVAQHALVGGSVTGSFRVNFHIQFPDVSDVPTEKFLQKDDI